MEMSFKLNMNISQAKHFKTHQSFISSSGRMYQITSTIVQSVKDSPTQLETWQETMWSHNTSQTHLATPVTYVMMF